MEKRASMVPNKRVSSLRQQISAARRRKVSLETQLQNVRKEHERLAISLAQGMCPLKKGQRFRVTGVVDAAAARDSGYLRHRTKLYDCSDKPVRTDSLYEVEAIGPCGQDLKDVTAIGYSINARRVLSSGTLSEEHCTISDVFTIEATTEPL